METRASYILVGAFVLALVAATFSIIIWMARVEFEEAPQRYAIFFAGSVTGLSVGSPVRYRGVPVGSVTGIALDPADIERILVEIEIAQGTPIKTDMVASLGFQGITGIAFIHMSGGTRAAPLLKPTARQPIPVIPSETSGIERLFAGAPELLDRAVALFESLARLVDEKNANAVSETLENIRALTGSIAADGDKIEAMIADARATLAALRETSEGVRGLSGTLHKKVPPVADGAIEVIGDVKTTLAEIRAATRSLRKVAEGLNSIVGDARTPLRDFSSNGLYEFAQFLTEARVLVAGLSRLTAQIERDPARFFFGDTQKGFEAK